MTVAWARAGGLVTWCESPRCEAVDHRVLAPLLPSRIAYASTQRSFVF